MTWGGTNATVGTVSALMVTVTSADALLFEASVATATSFIGCGVVGTDHTKRQGGANIVAITVSPALTTTLCTPMLSSATTSTSNGRPATTVAVLTFCEVEGEGDVNDTVGSDLSATMLIVVGIVVVVVFLSVAVARKVSVRPAVPNGRGIENT